MNNSFSIPEAIVEQKRKSPKKRDEKKQSALSLKLNFGLSRIKKQEVAQALRQLATLVQMRFPLDKSLFIVCEQIQNDALKKIFEDCKCRVEKGETLADALSVYAKYFPQAVLKFTMIGEVSGNLGDTLDQAASQMEKMLKLRRKLFSALSYPAIVVIVAIFAVGFLLAVVVPTFSDVFSDFGAQLPIATRILVTMGDFLVNYWYVLVLSVLGIVMLVQRMWKIPRLQIRMEKLIWKMAVIGPVIKKEKLTRFVRTLGMLLQNGILLPEAISISGKTSTSLNIEKKSEIIIERIKKGESFYSALNESAIFPAMLVQMARVGEEAGVLGDMLDRSAEYYESEIDAAIETLNAVLEPILIIGLGIVMGAIVIAMYWQIFNIVDVIQ